MTLKNQLQSDVCEVVSGSHSNMNLVHYFVQRMATQPIIWIKLETKDDTAYVEETYFFLFYIIASTIELILKGFSHCQVNIEIRCNQCIYCLTDASIYVKSLSKGDVTRYFVTTYTIAPICF